MSEAALRQIFADVLGVPLEKITDALSYDAIPEWDSFAHMSLIVVLDQTFGVKISAADIAAMKSFAKAKEILERYGVVMKS